MANAFGRLSARMDAVTVARMGKSVTINDREYFGVESHLLLELGPVNGDGVSLVIFTPGYRPRRNDRAVLDGQPYIVTKFQMMNGKPQIWLE